jgi:excisionase family DNA binding protein
MERQESTSEGRQADLDQVYETEWLTAAEAADYAGRIGISTVRAACSRNELRHVRVGGNPRGPIRIRREWIAEWLRRWTRGGDGKV